MYYIRNIETAVSEMAVSEMIVSKDKKLCNMRFFDRTKEIAALQEIKAMSEHSAQFTVVTGRRHSQYLQTVVTQCFVNNKSEIWS